jgi:hypothetical protein
VISSNATLAWGSLLSSDTFHFEAPTDGTGPVTRGLRNRAYKGISTDLDPRVGLALGSLPSMEGVVPSSSLRRLLLSLSLSRALAEGGRLLEPGKEICSVGGVLIASEACEEGDESPGTNESC